MRKYPNNTSVTLSDKQLKLFRELKANGYFPSVSAIVRFCINIALPELITEIKQLNNYIQDNNLFDVIKILQKFGYTISKNRQSILKKQILSTVINGENKVIQ